MLARYGDMSISQYEDIFYDLDCLTDKQKRKYFEELEKAGYIKKSGNDEDGEQRYDTISSKESKRVKEIAEDDDATYFDELEGDKAK